MLHLPVLPKHLVFVYHKHKISVIAAKQTEGKHCSSFYISLKGKFQCRSTGGHLLFLVNKMPILKFIPECDLTTGSKFCPFFSSSFSESSHCCWCSQSRDQRQRGAKEKRWQVKKGTCLSKSWEPKILSQMCFTEDEMCSVGAWEKRAVDPGCPAWCAGVMTSKDLGASPSCSGPFLWRIKYLHFFWSWYRWF